MVGEHLATFDPRDQTWTEAEHVFAYHPDAFTPLARITCQPHTTGKASIGHIDWFHTDQIGTPLALFNAEGKQTWTIKLDAWGKRLDTPPPPDPRYAFSGATDPNDQPIRLPGQYFDAESGMHYNRYRYYDPHAGRYVTQDPIRLVGGVNIYSYPHNPVQIFDPIGLEPACPCENNPYTEGSVEYWIHEWVSSSESWEDAFRKAEANKRTDGWDADNRTAAEHYIFGRAFAGDQNVPVYARAAYKATGAFWALGYQAIKVPLASQMKTSPASINQLKWELIAWWDQFDDNLDKTIKTTPRSCVK